MKSLPIDLQDADYFTEELVEVYGDDRAQAIVTQLGRESRYAFWDNPLIRMGGGELDEGELNRDTRQNFGGDVDSQSIPELPQMRSVARDSGITKSPAASSAEIYIQNPSSFLAVAALEPLAGDEVLDLAAAPGGKTIALAAMMKNNGRIAAVEPVKRRFHRLKANTERCGVTNVEFYLRDGRGVGRVVPERFDRVLLDAPCSSEARMRWFDPATYQHWSRQKVKETQRKQKSLIRSAYAALKPGGRLIYCTCSFSVAENELVVNHLLKRTDAKLEPLDLPIPDHIPGVVTWRKKSLAESLSMSCRILPTDVWDGFYIARVTKPSPG